MCQLMCQFTEDLIIIMNEEKTENLSSAHLMIVLLSGEIILHIDCENNIKYMQYKIIMRMEFLIKTLHVCVLPGISSRCQQYIKAFWSFP